MKEIISSDAPAAIGPYSHAVVHNDLIFCSGQIPLNPDTMAIDAATIEDQTRQVMENLLHVLKACGADLKSILKTTIFLDSMEDFTAMNTVYEEILDGHKPARSTVEVSRLPRGVKIEIECIASA